MGARIIRDLDYLHPELREIVAAIDEHVIVPHRVPIRLFETARTEERQLSLVRMRKANTVITRFVFNLDQSPPVYSTAVSYVHFVDRWSWDLRTRLIKRWYELFGELVIDLFGDRLFWGGDRRVGEDLTYFELSDQFCRENGIPIIPA